MAHELTHVVQQRIGVFRPGLSHKMVANHAARVNGIRQAKSVATSSLSDLLQLQPSEEKRASVRRFRGPSGRPIDPDVGKGLVKTGSVLPVAIGGAWPKGYPLVPGIYDGFLNFTFIKESYNAALVEREGQYLEIPLINITEYVRINVIVKGVWSARWIAVAYPWLIKKSGEVLAMTGVGVIIGGPMYRIGEEGIREAAEAGIPEACELLEEKEEVPELIAMIGRLKGCNLDANALIYLEKHGGAAAREIGVQKKLFTTEAARKEFSKKGNWPELKRKFNIKVLGKGPVYQRWVKDAKKMGLKEMDARVLAGSRANNLPLVTSDRHFLKAANKLKVVVRFFSPYIHRPGAPRHRPVPKKRIPRIRIR